ncbi:MAG: hypothetical protein H7X83_00925 [Verrucomicrobia bacterium]|nr:hypothetical protein [Deltaproteobacteria bacterium]
MGKSVQELTAERQVQAERVVSLVNEAAAAFKELHTSTGALGEELYRLNVEKSIQRHGRAPSITSPPIPGMNTLPDRVRAMIDYAFFGTGRNSVDLVGAVSGENNAALREADNG